MTSEKNYVIAKHNELIEAQYRLSTQEQRVIAFMCGQIRPGDRDFKPYGFKIKDFASLIGLEGEGYYSKLKMITRTLISKVLTIRDGKKVIQVSWLASAVYHERKGIVELRFAPELKPYLLQLKRCFTQYNLGQVLKLRSKYAFRLYEICKKNELIGKYVYPLDEFRAMLGVKPEELKQWGHFKTRALEPAIREICKKTDLDVSYKAIKRSRRIQEIELRIRKKHLEISQKIHEEPREDEPFKRLLSLIPEKHRNKKTILASLEKALRKHGESYCERNILYANKKSSSNYRAFLCKALSHDWALGWWEDTKETSQHGEILDSIKGARIRIGEEEFQADEDGFLFKKGSIIPPGELVKLVAEKKAEVVG